MAKRNHTDKATIVAVAAAAGVSVMSVSRAIRGVEGVSEQTRQRVLAIARDLNYTPNSNAQALATTGSTLIGISLPTLFNDVFADILLGMRRTFEQAGYSLLVQTTDYDTAREELWAEQLLAWRPAAAIFTGTDHSASLREKFHGEPVKTLEIWDVTDRPIGICVGIDHFQAGLDLGRYVAELGYRHPAFVGVPPNIDPRADKRFTGLATAFNAVAATPLRRVSVEPGNAFLMGAAGVARLDRNTMPDALFFLNDHMAFGGMMEIERMGLSAPQDIGIIGFNDLHLNAVLPRAMTTISTPRRQMGLVGARNLLAALHGVDPTPVTCLPCKLVPGATTRQI